MHLKKNASILLFISVILVIFLLSLVSFAGFAATSVNPKPTIVNYIAIDISRSLINDQIGPLLSNQSFDSLISISQTQTALTIYSGILTDTLTPTSTNTSTPTLTPTPSLTPTLTPTPSLTPTETPTPQPTAILYFPILYKERFVPTYTPTPTYTNTPTYTYTPTFTPTATYTSTPTYTRTPTSQPPKELLFCDDLNQSILIPDDDPDGINDDITISDRRLVLSLNLYLNIGHTWVGDLVVTLTNQSTGERITALDRPGIPHLQYGCPAANIITILDDGAIQPAEDKCAYSPAISGIYQPNESLNTFRGANITGTWRLNVSDHYPNDTGKLNHWCLQAVLSDALPPPTPTPTPVNLPSSAYVDGMTGQDQQLPLDCETRSAVDWAKHFGFNISELDFLANLPDSDDPEAGFVGDPRGIWGNIPPNDYGVHAPPIAKLLRDYDVPASAYRSLQWDDLRAEIASGNPAIVWIIGGANRNLVNGIPHYYTARSTGNTTIVAPNEHTVILVGYSPTIVTVLNGSKFVDIPLDQFFDSWSVLDFLAVLAPP